MVSHDLFFVFEYHLLVGGNICYQNDHGNSSVASFFGNHAQAQADLSMVIDGKPYTVLILGLDCSPNGPVWTNFKNFCKFLTIFQQTSVGLF